MGTDSEGRHINKLTIDIEGMNAIERCVRTFSRCVDGIVIVSSEANEEAALLAERLSEVPVKTVRGGERRQDSVLNGVRAANCGIVVIHDCARCFVTERIIMEAVESAAAYGSGAAAIKVRDTVRYGGGAAPVDRNGLMQMQTPQAFDREKLIAAYTEAGDATDDAAIWERVFGPVRLTGGSISNQKITERDDIPEFIRFARGGHDMRFGIGEDTHRLVPGRKLILGGVEIPFRLGLLGHSDADALIHAVIDAMLGAAALGDIGRHFPDTDPKYKGISSVILLKKAAYMLRENGYEIGNTDAVITAQEPKLAPYIDEMRKTIADALGVGIERVGLKATTPEHLGPEGNSESITVRAVACIRGI